MAGTTYFEERVRDLKRDRSFDLALGLSSFYGEKLISRKVFDDTFILDEQTGRRLAEAMY